MTTIERQFAGKTCVKLQETLEISDKQCKSHAIFRVISTKFLCFFTLKIA